MSTTKATERDLHVPKFNPKTGDKVRLPNGNVLVIFKRTPRTVTWHDGQFMLKTSIKEWRETLNPSAEVIHAAD